MGLDLDEWIFGKVAKYLKKKKDKTNDSLPQKVALEEIKPRLILLARAISGKAIEIYPAEEEGGYKGNNYFLPIEFSEMPTWETNLSFYFFRLLYLSVQQEKDINWSYPEDDVDLSRKMALQSAEEILPILYEQFPVAAELHKKFYDYFMQQAENSEDADFSMLYGKWMQKQKAEQQNDPLKNFDEKVQKPADKADTIVKARAVEEIKSISIDKKQQEDYVLLHNFEKVETAEEHDGVWRDFDGSDELEKHQDALEELRMRQTVRVDEPVHSVYQADFVEQATISESAEKDSKAFYVSYDEWDYKSKSYKKDFCKLFPDFQKELDFNYYQNTIRKNKSVLNSLRKMVASINNKAQQQRRLSNGSNFDLDAVVDFYTDMHAKRTPNENIYTENRKKQKDLSLMILLDLSLSSDSFVNNRRVLDVEKEVSILFGEILNEFGIDFCIDGFYSKTRNHSSYLTIKDFDENWTYAKNKVGAIAPSGYTRIGTALRHAGTRLQNRESQNKWVILLSDGKPNDYDRYEGKYGVKDVKQALKEFDLMNINSYAVAIESQAKYYLPQMFGQNHYQILSKPEDLIHSLVKLYTKIKNQ
ncbi:nitric oxide reductase activation protein NorD [Marivirga harenae]|uniref:nitric oxide reductase activation protein NorD n=1 Tax=Marivirga harenae TaxID=2010992 RepID=UPI0026E0866B|nr:VWA domain-containing protein [Marivirga harenae]WKV12950.1 VWA domain-containing protein [Marivirga harenae]